MYRSYREKVLLKMAASKGALKVVVLLGSTREGRQGLRVTKFIKKQLEDASHSVEVLGK